MIALVPQSDDLHEFRETSGRAHGGVRRPAPSTSTNSGRPPVAPTAGSGDPRRARARIQGDLRSRPRRGQETRAEHEHEFRETSGRATAGSGARRRARAERPAPSTPSDPRRARRATRAERFLKRYCGERWTRASAFTFRSWPHNRLNRQKRYSRVSFPAKAAVLILEDPRAATRLDHVEDVLCTQQRTPTSLPLMGNANDIENRHSSAGGSSQSAAG